MTDAGDEAGAGGEPSAADPPGHGRPAGNPPAADQSAGDTPEGDQQRTRLTAWVAGRVQGVGFRWWVRSRALELGLAGAAENLEDGRVRVIAEGGRERCTALLVLLSGPGAPGRVSRVTHRWDAPTGEISGFAER